ncbi:putative phage-associated protein [Bacteroidales bacterium Barb6]|nr:putative phage-associated protein [Bacteroidales bacterium Barb6]
MKTNATALANYFISLAKRDDKELYQLGLMKRVYITHGFCLALYDRPALDDRFDKVEAWKNGPVIPSVYHSFKYHRNQPIREESVISNWAGDKMVFETPELKDKMVKDVADFVWERYDGMNDFDMVNLTHKKGTPWALCYIEGENNPIPDLYTKSYYIMLVK